jgi:hypothetical protein
MANAQEIELFIDDNGELKVHLKGIKGKSCAGVMDSLVSELGTEKSRTLTSEYYEPETQAKNDTQIRENPA